MSVLGYTNEELSRLGDHAFPERGIYCPKCRNYIPKFVAVDAAEEQRLRSIRLRSMVEIRRLTGCNMIFAKIWAIHPYGPHPKRLGPPCPYCSLPLFSEGTRQCIQCGWDWHDPDNPVQHVVALKPDRATWLPAEPDTLPEQSLPPRDLLRAAYAAFNARDIDAALALMTSDVAWPRAFKGGFVRGPEEVRAYWTEQWSEIDPHVEPLAFHPEDAGRILVEVHQVVRDLAGTLLADERVGHRFTVANDLIQGMEVCSLPSGHRFDEAKA